MSKLSQENNKDRSYVVIIALTVVLVLLAAAVYAGSQTMASDTVNTIHMNGHAEMQVVPDTASMNIGTVVQAPTAKQASEENAAIMSAVIEELKSLGLEDKEMQTSYVSVYPIYDYEKGRTITAYSASNSVQISTQKLDMLGSIIDKSAAAGANQIGGISFTVSDAKQKELRNELIGEAADDASSKAEMLAQSLGVGIVGVHTSSISDTSQPLIYYDRAAVEVPMEESPSTPVEPGESTVSMSVQVTYIIG